MAPRSDDDAPVYIDEIHQDIAEFAARHADHLDEDFIDSMLESHGYQRTQIWGPPDDGGGSGGGQQRRPGVKKPAPGQRQGGQGGGGRGGPYFGGKSR